MCCKASLRIMKSAIEMLCMIIIIIVSGERVSERVRMRERERERPEGLSNAALAHKAQVLPMLLITTGVSILLMTLGHAHLQGQERPVAERVVTVKNVWFP